MIEVKGGDSRGIQRSAKEKFTLSLAEIPQERSDEEVGKIELDLSALVALARRKASARNGNQRHSGIITN